MLNATLQKSGFIILPHDRTIEEFLDDVSLKVYWREDDAKPDYTDECFLSDEKHKPSLVPILLSVPLNTLALRQREENQPNFGQLRGQRRAIPAEELPQPVNGFFEVAQARRAVEAQAAEIAVQQRENQ